MTLHQLQFRAELAAKRALFGTGKFLIALLHGFPKSVTVHAGKQMPMHRIPARSTKRDAKRAALANMRQAVADPNMSWRRARKLIDAELRRARELERATATVDVDMSQFNQGDHVAMLTSDATVSNGIDLTKQSWWRRWFFRSAA